MTDRDDNEIAWAFRGYLMPQFHADLPPDVWERQARELWFVMTHASYLIHQKQSTFADHFIHQAARADETLRMQLIEAGRFDGSEWYSVAPRLMPVPANDWGPS